MAENEEDSNLFFNGLVIGGIVGGVLGLLFAPEKGEETREKIKNKIKNLNSEEVLGEFGEKGKEVLEGAQQFLAQITEKVSLAVEEGRKAAQEKKEMLDKEGGEE